MRQLILATLIALPASAAAGTADPAQLPAAFVAAWNSHELASFEKLYTADATWVPVAEERTEGRAAILGEFAKIHTNGGWATRTTIALKGVTKVQSIRPDVAVVFFHMDFLDHGQPVAGLQRALVLVAQRHAGDWRIAAGQLTKETPAR